MQLLDLPGGQATEVAQNGNVVLSQQRRTQVRPVGPGRESRRFAGDGEAADMGILDIPNRSARTQMRMVDDLVQPRTIVLGQALADKYGLGIGDRIEVISPTGHSSVMGFVPRIAKYRIVALFEVGMNTYDASYGFVSLKSAQKFFRKGKGVSFVEVAIDDADRFALLIV